jgi:hypothetical protein
VICKDHRSDLEHWRGQPRGAKSDREEKQKVNFFASVLRDFAVSFFLVAALADVVR